MVAGTVLQQQALDIHRRLLLGDPTAPADAAALLLDPLVKRLRSRWPGQQFEEACHDAAVEVIVQYLQSPDRYEPAQSSLLTWLTMQAHGDLLNAYASPQKKFEQSWVVEAALRSDDPESDTPLIEGLAHWDDPSPITDASVVFEAVKATFPDEVDRRLIFLTCIEGVKATDAAAAVLGLGDLPEPERTAEVKRHKDRIMRRLRRLGLVKDDG